jgi:hypothetical protein
MVALLLLSLCVCLVLAISASARSALFSLFATMIVSGERPKAPVRLPDSAFHRTLQPREEYVPTFRWQRRPASAASPGLPNRPRTASARTDGARYDVMGAEDVRVDVRVSSVAASASSGMRGASSTSALAPPPPSDGLRRRAVSSASTSIASTAHLDTSGASLSGVSLTIDGSAGAVVGITTQGKRVYMGRSLHRLARIKANREARAAGKERGEGEEEEEAGEEQGDAVQRVGSPVQSLRPPPGGSSAASPPPIATGSRSAAVRPALYARPNGRAMGGTGQSLLQADWGGRGSGEWEELMPARSSPASDRPLTSPAISRMQRRGGGGETTIPGLVASPALSPATGVGGEGRPSAAGKANEGAGELKALLTRLGLPAEQYSALLAAEALASVPLLRALGRSDPAQLRTALADAGVSKIGHREALILGLQQS